MNMQNIKAFKWGTSTSLLLLTALFTLRLEVVVGRKAAAISSKVEKTKRLAEPTTQMPVAVVTLAPPKDIPSKLQESSPLIPAQEPTLTGDNHPLSALSSNHPAPHLTSNKSQSSQKDPLSSPPPRPDKLLKRKPKHRTVGTITIHPYSHNPNKKSNSPHLPHTWKGRKISNPVLGDNQLTNSTDSGDKASRHLSTPSPVSDVSKLKSTSLSQPKTSQVSKVQSSTQILNNNQFVNSTKSRDKPSHHSTTHSPVSHNPKLKSTSQSKPQTSQVSKISSAASKVAQFFNKTDKPGHRSYHPSPGSRDSKPNSVPPSRTQALKVTKLSSPALTVNELTNSTVVGDKASSNPSTTLANSKIALAQPQTSRVTQVSNTSLVMVDNQVANSGNKTAHHAKSPSQSSHKSKIMSATPGRNRTSKVDKLSKPNLKDNQVSNTTESGHKRHHHTSTPSHHNVKSDSPPVSQTQPTTASTPILTDIVFVNYTDESASYPSTPSPGYNVSKLESVPSTQSPVTQVSNMPSPTSKDTQLLNSTKPAHKSTHHTHNASHISEPKSPYHPSAASHNSNSAIQPQPQTLQVTKVSSPVLTDSQDSAIKSTSLSQPHTSQVSNVSTSIVTENQVISLTDSRDKLARNPSTPSPVSHVSQSKPVTSSPTQVSQVNKNSKLKPVPPQQASQLKKISNPVLANNQFHNATVLSNQPGRRPNKSSQVLPNSKLKSTPPAPQQTLQIRKVSSPVVTDSQGNSTKSRDKPVHHPTLPTQVSTNSNLKPTHLQPLQVNNLTNPLLTDDQLVNSRVSRKQPGHHPHNSSRVHQNSKLKSAHQPQQQSLQSSNVSNQPGNHHAYNEPLVTKNSNSKSVSPVRTPALQVHKVSSPVLIDDQLVNSTKTVNKPGHHPSTPSPTLHAKLKSVSPSRHPASLVDSVSSPVSKDNQPHSFQVHKVSSPNPIVKDISFVTSTESGDKAAHFKVTFR